MNKIEKKKQRSMNNVLVVGGIIILLLLSGIFALSYYSKSVEQTDSTICGVLPVDQQSACCGEKHLKDIIPACTGNWTYSDSKEMCEFKCWSEKYVYCPADVKECPDGSFVSRDSNNGCEFKECS
jgi:hypothetical protein